MKVKKDKRILFLASNLLSGGAERQIVTVSRLLKRKGYDVSFYCYGKGDFYGHLLREDNIPIKWEYTFNNPLKRIIKARSFIRKGGFDTVISFLPAENFLNDVAAIGGHRWKVITGLRFWPTSAPRTVKDKLYAWMLRFSDSIVSNSRLAMETWCKYRPNNRHKFHVIYNNVQLGTVNSTYIARKNGKFHIVVAASFQELKNPQGLIAALMLMTKEELDGVVIDWYGANSGDVYQRISKSIEENGFEGSFVLHEPSDDIYNIMNQADAVMLISHREGLPNAICEGMALGKPVIMTRVSDFAELVDKSNGFLCDSYNPNSIKETIVAASNCTVQQLAELGRSSRQKSELLFSNEIITKNWELLL